MKPLQRRGLREESGVALTTVAFVIVGLAALMSAMTTSSWASYMENRQSRDDIDVFYAAETGLKEAFAIMRAGGPEALEIANYPKDIAGTEFSLQVQVGADDPNLDDSLIRLVGTATRRRSQSSMEVILQTIGGDEEVPWQVFGDDQVSLASNASIDSYDATLGSWSSQASNRWQGKKYANTSHGAASNKSIHLDSNALVAGNARPGPSGAVSVESNSKVTGSTTPAKNDLELPAVEIPSIAQGSSLKTDNRQRKTIGPGDIGLNTLEVNGNSRLTIRGPATVLAKNVLLDSNADIIIDASGGPVEVFVQQAWEQKSNTSVSISTGLPKDLRLSFGDHRSDVSFDSNATFEGVVYAPSRHVILSSNMEIFGAVMSGRLSLDSNTAIHLDESLGGTGVQSDDGSGTSVDLLAWRPTGR